MPRPKRVQYPGAFYHVFNRGINKKSVYFSPNHYVYFLKLLEDVWKKYNFSVHAYCLMKNHFHLLIEIHDECLSDIMRSLISQFATHLNKNLNADGSVFKDRFKSILIDSNQYLLNVMRYIHLNPIKAKICQQPKHYKWSSFNNYLLTDPKHCFLTTSLILNYFKTPNEFDYYHQFGIDKEIESFYEKTNISSVMGSQNFKLKILKRSR